MHELPVYTDAQRRAAVEHEVQLQRLNDLLSQAGAIADRLTQSGYDVLMTLWDAERGSYTVRGRLQANVAKASIRPAERLR